MTPPLSSICLVVDSLDIGGAERHVVDLALALDQAGFAVTIACSQGGPLSEHLAGACVRVWPLLNQRAKRTVSLAYARRLRALLVRERFELVHAHLYASAAAAALGTLGTGTPLVVTEHSEGRWQGLCQRAVSRRYLRRAGHAIAVSACIERHLVDDLGVPAERVSLIPNAVGPPTPLDQQALPAEWRRDPRTGPLVGVVGRLEPEKGHAVFLEAVALLEHRAAGLRFVVAGDGSMMGALERLARARGIEERVHFLGEIPNGRALIADLDVLVVPSLTEGSPLVVLEALSSGVPVVASRVGGVPEQLSSESAGLLVPPGDPRELARGLAHLLERRELPHSEARAVRKLAEHERMVRDTLMVYANALRRSGERKDQMVATAGEASDAYRAARAP